MGTHLMQQVFPSPRPLLPVARSLEPSDPSLRVEFLEVVTCRDLKYELRVVECMRLETLLSVAVSLKPHRRRHANEERIFLEYLPTMTHSLLAHRNSDRLNHLSEYHHR
jgi:hypothetical protein